MLSEPRGAASQKVGGSAIIRRISQRTSSLRFESGVANAAEPRPLPRRPRPSRNSTPTLSASETWPAQPRRSIHPRRRDGGFDVLALPRTTAAVAVGPRPIAPRFSLTTGTRRGSTPPDTPCSRHAVDLTRPSRGGTTTRHMALDDAPAARLSAAAPMAPPDEVRRERRVARARDRGGARVRESRPAKSLDVAEGGAPTRGWRRRSPRVR